MNAAIHVAVMEKDNGSRDLFMMLLEDEEGHVDWLEAQMHLIQEIGYERYLTMQMGERDDWSHPAGLRQRSISAKDL